MRARAGALPLPRIRVFYGWWVLIGCSSLVFYNAGSFYFAMSAYFNPIRDALSLSATVVAAAFALRNVEGGLEAPLMGYLVDKVGPRKMILVGSFVIGLGMMLLATVTSIWTFYGAILIIGLGMGGTTGIMGMTTVSNWFVRRRSFALGLYTSGAGLGGFLVPVVVWLIARNGWRQTLFVTGVGYCILGVVMTLVVRQRPEQMGLLADGEAPRKVADSQATRPSEEVNFTVAQALRTRAFWFMAVALTLSSIAPQAIAVTQIPYLESRHISTATAGFVVSAMAVTSVLGRVGFGWLGDRVDKRRAMAAVLGMEAVGVIILASIGAAWMLIPYLLLYSPAWGGAVPLRPAILADYYGRKAVGSIHGVMLAIMTGASIVGPVLAGASYDVLNSYRPALYLLAVLAGVGAPLMLLAKRPVLKKVAGQTVPAAP